MTFPKIGNMAPAFTLLNQAGEKVSLKDFKGKKNVVIYFYPKAATPGCTTQACGIRDSKAEFERLDTVVLGISPDAPKKLQKFIDKYGVWGLKKFMGREYMGIFRTSFLVDKNGHLRYIMDKVNTKTHDQEVIAYISEHF